MSQPLIAADPGKLDTILHQLERLHKRLDRVEMERKPEWLLLAEYAKHVGKTERTVRNWIRAGEVDSKRDGKALMVRISPAA